MNQVILWIMAAGVVLGGIDRIFGSPKGYGKKFEEGFFFLGPTALSMAGMICLAPVLAKTLGRLIIPAFGLLGVDPAMFGGLLAIDMGGYQLACSLAQNPLMGQYAGIVIAAVFGCTVVFTIPVGMGIVEKEDKPLFAQGIMIGLMVMPVSLVAGGLVCGLSLLEIVHQNLPVLVFSLLLLLGLKKALHHICLRDSDSYYPWSGDCGGDLPYGPCHHTWHGPSGGCPGRRCLHRHRNAGKPSHGGAFDQASEAAAPVAG